MPEAGSRAAPAPPREEPCPQPELELELEPEPEPEPGGRGRSRSGRSRRAGRERGEAAAAGGGRGGIRSAAPQRGLGLGRLPGLWGLEPGVGGVPLQFIDLFLRITPWLGLLCLTGTRARPWGCGRVRVPPEGFQRKAGTCSPGRAREAASDGNIFLYLNIYTSL